MGNASDPQPLVLCTQSADVFAARLSDALGLPRAKVATTRFSNDNLECRVPADVCWRKVLLVQSALAPVSDRVMEAILTLDALRRQPGTEAILVMPYLLYARSDKIYPGCGVGLRALGDVLQALGTRAVITVDPHCVQSSGMFSVPMILVSALERLAGWFEGVRGREYVAVAPDAGAVGRTKAFASYLGIAHACMHKTRRAKGEGVKAVELFGDVSGRAAIIVDDEIDTGGSQIAAAEELLNRGALSVIGCYTHGIFSGDAVSRIEASVLERVVVTDSVRPEPPAGSSKVELVSVVDTLAKEVGRFLSLG